MYDIRCIRMSNVKRIQMSNIKLIDVQHLNDERQKDLNVILFDVLHSNFKCQTVGCLTFEC